MFKKMQFRRNETTPEAMHREMKVGIIPLNSLNKFANRDFGIKFFSDFTNKR